MTLAEKFTRLKTSVGGNREKMHFEDTFGMPKEEQAHITRPAFIRGRKRQIRRCFGGSAGLSAGKTAD